MKKYWLIWIAFTWALVSAPAFGSILRFDSMHRGDSEVAFMVGYGANHRYPAATKDRFQFDICKVRYAKFTSPRTQLAVDLATGTKASSDENFAVWATTSYRRYVMVRGSTAIGVDFNIGLLHLREPVAELGTKTNFTEQIGVVFQHATSEHSAISLEYKFSHVSNAGIKLPNIGINASMVSVGYSWYK